MQSTRHNSSKSHDNQGTQFTEDGIREASTSVKQRESAKRNTISASIEGDESTWEKSVEYDRKCLGQNHKEHWHIRGVSRGEAEKGD